MHTITRIMTTSHRWFLKSGDLEHLQSLQDAGWAMMFCMATALWDWSNLPVCPNWMWFDWLSINDLKEQERIKEIIEDFFSLLKDIFFSPQSNSYVTMSLSDVWTSCYYIFSSVNLKSLQDASKNITLQSNKNPCKYW